MAYSKPEVHFPKDWTKHHHVIGNEAVNEELLAEDELVDWLTTMDMCDKSTIKKYIEIIRPYHFIRCIAVLFPNNLSSCRNIFKIYVHFLIGIFISDDRLETYNSTELRQIRDSYEMLEGQSSAESFLPFPTIAKMKASLKINKKLMPTAIYMVDYTNMVVHSLIQQGTISEDDLAYFRKRIYINHSMYLEAIEAEKSPRVDDTVTDLLWRRIFSGAAVIFLLGLEAMSGLVVKAKAHATLIAELQILSSLVCMLINDIYSYRKEMLSKASNKDEKGDNLVALMIEKKEVSETPEAIQKISQICNAIIKFMYQKIEKTKQEYPDNTDLHKLLNDIGLATVGWFFFHDSVSNRYQDTPWCLSLVEVEEKELKEWRESKEEEQSVILKRFFDHTSPKGKLLIDAMCGLIKPRAHFVPT